MEKYPSIIDTNTPKDNQFLDLDTSGTSLYKKSEKLATALFLVSDIMADNDILKTNIKSLALELVSNAVFLKYNFSSHKFTTVNKLQQISAKTMSLLDIAAISGLISDMNASILKKEFEVFMQNLSIISNSYDIKKELGEPVIPSMVSGSSNSDNGVRNGLHLEKDTQTKDKEVVYLQKDKINRKDGRTKIILDLVARKNDVSIKDISLAIKGCSEKTIQRELLTLVREGILKKVGERRWSRYSLVA